METKRAKVIMLPTDKETGIFGLKTSVTGDIETLHYSIISKIRTESKSLSKGYHLYITTDDEIKEGDWFLWGKDSLIDECTHITDLFISTKETDYPISRCKKIIATTDKSLVTKKEQAGDSVWVQELPQPSQSFIEKYCKVGGIDEVMVELQSYGAWVDEVWNHIEYKLKIDSHNTITIHTVKDSWSREEIDVICSRLFNDIYHTFRNRKSATFNLTDWIKENL